jgi:hypothetical protein
MSWPSEGRQKGLLANVILKDKAGKQLWADSGDDKVQGLGEIGRSCDFVYEHYESQAHCGFPGFFGKKKVKKAK